MPSARGSSSTAATSAKRMRSAIASARAGGTAECRLADLADVEACRGVVRFTIETFGGIDVLVNNAASVARGYIEDAPVELWDAIMAVNLRAPFLCLQEAVKSMKTRGGGSIVNIGSVNAYIGEPKLGPYSVSKGGLMTLTRNAAASLNRYRIRVNQLNVGWTLTEGEERVKRAEGQRTGMAGRGNRHPALRPAALAPRHRPRRGLLRLGRQCPHNRRGHGSRAVSGRRAAELVGNRTCRRASASFRSAISTSSSTAAMPSSSGSATRRRSAAKASSTTTASSAASRRPTSSRSRVRCARRGRSRR